MNYFIAILLLIISYILGSIPNAVLVSKIVKGIDIRDYGSKNMGATNVFRVMGFWWGLVVFLLDALKAGLIVGLVHYNAFGLRDMCFPSLFYGVAAIVGHLFPIFCKFKGGKGVSCTAGVMLAFKPLAAIMMITLFVIIMLTTKIISIASLVATTGLLIWSIVELCLAPTDVNNILFVAFTTLAFIVIFVKHRANIKRIHNHTESSIDSFNKSAKDEIK